MTLKVKIFQCSGKNVKRQNFIVTASHQDFAINSCNLLLIAQNQKTNNFNKLANCCFYKKSKSQIMNGCDQS